MGLLSLLHTRRRLACLLGALCCVLLLAFALYSEFYMGLAPCPLCIFQRVAMAALGMALLLAALPPAGWRLGRMVSAVLVAVAALSTIGVAARHLYIQSLPPGSVAACGASLDYMLDVFPLADVLRKVLTGSGECAKVSWTLLGLSMPGWVLLWAAALGAVGTLASWPRRSR